MDTTRAPCPPGTVRRVVFVAPLDLQTLDVAGPAEVFARTEAVLGRLSMPITGTYRVELASIRQEAAVPTSCGLSLSPAVFYQDLRGPIDTLLVAGGRGVEEAAQDPGLQQWLRTQAATVRRIGSICTGAFPLAGAGLLDGRRATTHWQWCDRFRSLFPRVHVDSERIFIRDPGISTSVGITAGMDLALSMVEEDHGYRVAIQIARELVMSLRRPGGQSQFSTALAGQFSGNETWSDLIPWMLAHLHQPLRVEDLAAKAGMSARNFTRVFTARTGYSPAAYIERVRVEAACRRLAESSKGTKEIATECGFRDADTMRKAFHRVLHTTPQLYRHAFAAAAPPVEPCEPVEVR